MRSFQILFEFESDVQIRFDSKVTGRFENFESPRLPRLPSYNKQHSLFNDKFQSFRHCYWDLLPAIRLLERRARYLFYFCCFVRFLSTISRQPAGQFTPNFACGRTVVPNVSSPLLGVGGPRRAEKGGNEIFFTMGVNGEFLHFGGF